MTRPGNCKSCSGNCARPGLIGDLLLLTEHEHVYTIGKGGDDNHLLPHWKN